MHRIIARLDIKGPNVVKGIHLEGLRVLGKPEDFARYYYENNIDELIYMDVVASLYNRNSLHELILKAAKEIFMPLTVGGGLRTIDDIKMVLHAGADKVSLNTAAIKNPNIIKEAAKKFGSSTIAISIEAIMQPNGEYFIFTDNGREYTGIEALTWAKKVENLGAGEIILTSINNEGTGLGFDVNLIRTIAKNVSIPVVAHGGAGKLEHVLEAIKDGGADAVCLSSMLHYQYLIENNIHTKSFIEGNLEFIKSGNSFSKVKPYEVKQIKGFLIKNNIECRYD